MKLIHCAVLAGLLAATGCAEKEILLPGQRTDLRPAVGLAPPEATQNRSVPIRLSAPTNHSSWTHVAGTASHTIRHPALSPTPRLAWQRQIGSGSDRKHRITTDPVAAGGLIFTLDSRSTVTATGTGGQTIWSRDLTPPGERVDDASGGGLAVSGGQLFATTGFGELVAIEAASGAVQWRQNLGSSATGAPTVAGGQVYVVSRDSRGWAVDAGTGRVKWQVQGTPSVTGVVGGPSPAVAGKVVLFPFSSAELLAAFPGSGLQVWKTPIAGSRLGRAYAGISDISADPVVVGNTVYVGTPAGRVAALGLDDGLPVWTAGTGAVGPVTVEGGSVFLISDTAELQRLDAGSGEVIWSVDLPYFVPVRRTKNLEDVVPHYGPVLAGGRLWVASGDGMLRGFDPTNGAMVTTSQMAAAAASRPIVVNGVLYVVGQDGTLQAFR